jgi:hypothetical protein
LNENEIRSGIQKAVQTGTSSEDVKRKVVANCDVLSRDVIVEFANRNAAHVVVEASGDRRKIQVVHFPFPDRRHRHQDRRKKLRLES